MDPRDGEVLAMANWPRVDANDAVRRAPAYATQNRAVGFTYEPGSTFKAITVAGALEDGTVTPDTTFDLPPQIQVADRTIGESHPRGYVHAQRPRRSSPSRATSARSRSACELGERALRPLGAALRLRHADRRRPARRGARASCCRSSEYSGSSMGNLPIGQGVAVTPMQMATAYAAIANGGILRTPQVVRRVDGKRGADAEGPRVISRHDRARSCATMLEGVLAPGRHGEPRSTIPGYELAGKTGTANKVDPETGEYSETRYVASFVGFAPGAPTRGCSSP